MRSYRRRPIEISRVPALRILAADAKSGPVFLSTMGRPSHVLLQAEDFERLSGDSRVADSHSEDISPPPEPGEQRYRVLCRFDAWANYVAQVDAESAEDAAERAHDGHGDYEWRHDFTQEFDAREYVTLDADGSEIEATKIGDF